MISLIDQRSMTLSTTHKVVAILAGLATLIYFVEDRIINPSGLEEGPTNDTAFDFPMDSSKIKTPDPSYYGIVKDPAGKQYKTINLFGKTWLAENLDYAVSKESLCYSKEKNNCQAYGRLFYWKDAKKACFRLGPSWRLPTIEEWKDLIKRLGGKNIAYPILTVGGQLGFNAIWGGKIDFKRDYSGDYKHLSVDLATKGYYWSSSDYWLSSGGLMKSILVFDRNKSQVRATSTGTTDRLSCRCIKD